MNQTVTLSADDQRFSFKDSLRVLATPVPLPLIQPVLARIIKSISTQRPEIFSRIGVHQQKTFVIDANNLPFVMVLKPDPKSPSLRACRRRNISCYDAKISGSFLTLLGMIDGRYDGDALFFTRDLRVEGDTEAVVCLRNALDDIDGNLADDLADLFGSIGQHSLKLLRKVSDDVRAD